MGKAITFPLYSILCSSQRRLHPNGFFSQDSWVGVPKLSQVGVSELWTLISPNCRVRSRQGLNQSCSSHQELFNAVLHSRIGHREEVDYRLLVVGSQTGSLTPGPSFGQNLCFRCPNEQCEPILDIYVPRDFQWYKERHKTLSFDPWNRSLKFRESTETPSPKVGVTLGMWVFTPSHSLTLPYIPRSMWCDSRASSWFAPLWPLCLGSRASSWLATLQPFCLGREPKARVATMVELQGNHEHVITNSMATKGLYRCVLHMNMLKSLLWIHLHCELCVDNVNVHMQVCIVSSEKFRVYAGPSFTF